MVTFDEVPHPIFDKSTTHTANELVIRLQPERLLMDTVKGNLTPFMRRDELDAAWAWIDPIRAGWEQYDERPKIYIAGSWGPASSSSMIGRDGFAWHDEL